ncbi:hypothetical protein [Streptomyces bauhiniae]
MSDSPEALGRESLAHSRAEQQALLDRLFAIHTRDDRAIAMAVAEQELASQVGQGVKLAPDAAIAAQIHRAAQFKVPPVPSPSGTPTGRQLDSSESSLPQANTRPGGIDRVALELLIKQLVDAWTASGVPSAAAVVPPASPRRATRRVTTPTRTAAVTMPMNRSPRPPVRGQ